MSESINIATQISIRNYGKDEYWLQDLIFNEPSCLGLGELQAIDKERRQSSGGRLDILLKNPDDDTMYEVEVMLGETDESHIIRTIEYWDIEKRRWPQRQHFAVIVAETINRRFFNVIHLLSHSIPIIAIQAALLETNGNYHLHFSKILDTFEEIDDGTSLEEVKTTREDWLKKAKWTVDTLEKIATITTNKFPNQTINFAKPYVAINVDGYNYLWAAKRSNSKSILSFKIQLHHQDDFCEILDSKSISYTKKHKTISFMVDIDFAEHEEELINTICDYILKP